MWQTAAGCDCLASPAPGSAGTPEVSLSEAKRTLACPEAAVLSILEQALPVFCSSSSCWPARGAKKNTLHGMWKCGYKRVVPFPS